MPLVEAGRALYRQKETKPKKLVSSFAKEKRKVAFSRGPVKREILVPKWHIEAFSSVGQEPEAQRKRKGKTGALQLVNRRLMSIRKKKKKKKLTKERKDKKKG